MKIENSLVKKFILKTMLFSTLITIPFILGNLWLEYKNELKNIQHSFEQFEKSELESLSYAVWYLDRNQIHNQLDGLIKISPYAHIKLETEIIGKIEKNSSLVINGPIKSFTLLREDKKIGVITLETSLDPLINNLALRFIIILVSVLLNTGLVAGFILYMLRKQITNPLMETTNFIRRVTFNQSLLVKDETYLGEQKHQIKKLNELEIVDQSVHQMEHIFQKSYKDLLETKDRINDILNFSSKAFFETCPNMVLNFISVADHKSNDGLDEYFKINKSLLDLPFDDSTKIEILKQKDTHDIYITLNDYHYHIILKATNSDNNFIGFRGIMFDITESVKNAEKIKEQNNQIIQMQKTGAIGEITASLAHDFRNYLTIITYTNDYVLTKTREEKISFNDEKILRHIRNAYDAALKADHLITKMLDFSRQQSNAPEVINLYQQTLSMRQILEVAITKNYHLDISCTHEISNCQLDVNLFESAILNLCVNAKDALKNHGMVKIEFSQIEVANRPDNKNGPFVLMKFTDNGVGMNEETLKNIFEPFFTTKPKGKGTGLGLSMIFNFVNNLKGFIEVQSIEGMGTSFSLYFPTIENTITTKNNSLQE